MLRRLIAVVFILSLVAKPRLEAQQGGTTTYAYDDDGRLIAVISPTGEASVYEYGAAGNFMAIRRLTPNDLTILAFTPGQSPIGMSVTIYGTGFNQGVSTVSFNGTVANITSSNLATVVAVVPEGATTGPITVVTPRGAVTSTRPFVVRGVRVTPDLITVSSLETVQFSLSITGTPTNSVVWSVSGVIGRCSTNEQTLGQPNPVTLPNAPTLVVASVGGIAAPTNRAGSFNAPPDIIVPTSVPNPVQVVVNGTNLPSGTAVQVKLTPESGNPTTVSGTLTGSTSSSTITVNLSLPSGGLSIIRATVTLDVLIAYGKPIFINGERVEKIEVATSFGGASEVIHVTSSGRRVTTADLQK